MTAKRTAAGVGVSSWQAGGWGGGSGVDGCREERWVGSIHARGVVAVEWMAVGKRGGWGAFMRVATAHSFWCLRIRYDTGALLSLHLPPQCLSVFCPAPPKLQPCKHHQQQPCRQPPSHALTVSLTSLTLALHSSAFEQALSTSTSAARAISAIKALALWLSLPSAGGRGEGRGGEGRGAREGCHDSGQA